MYIGPEKVSEGCLSIQFFQESIKLYSCPIGRLFNLFLEIFSNFVSKRNIYDHHLLSPLDTFFPVSSLNLYCCNVNPTLSVLSLLMRWNSYSFPLLYG